MPTLVSQQEMNNSATVFNNMFDTWSRPIIVYKEPLKVQILPQNSDALFGFGTSQSTELYSYTPVTGSFSALIRYAGKYASDIKGDKLEPEIDEYIAKGPVSIKVRVDAQDFISNNGKTQRIDIDGYPYILSAVDPRPQIFWGNEFFIYDLERKF
jgi:hypothetical protein